MAAFGLDEHAGGDLAGTALAGGPDRDKPGGAPMLLGGPAAFEAIAWNLLSFIGPGNDFNAPSSSAGSTCAMTLRSSMGTQMVSTLPSSSGSSWTLTRSYSQFSSFFSSFVMMN